MFNYAEFDIASVTPTNWRLFTSDVLNEREIFRNALPQEYILKDLIPEGIYYDESDFDCFNEVAQVLNDFENLNRFGLGLYLPNKSLGPDEVMLESTI